MRKQEWLEDLAEKVAAQLDTSGKSMEQIALNFEGIMMEKSGWQIAPCDTLHLGSSRGYWEMWFKSRWDDLEINVNVTRHTLSRTEGKLVIEVSVVVDVFGEES